MSGKNHRIDPVGPEFVSIREQTEGEHSALEHESVGGVVEDHNGQEVSQPDRRQTVLEEL